VSPALGMIRGCVRNDGRMIMTGENRSTRRKPSSLTLCPDLTWADLVLIAGLRDHCVRHKEHRCAYIRKTNRMLCREIQGELFIVGIMRTHKHCVGQMGQ
jgi:hypothetical protein